MNCALATGFKRMGWIAAGVAPLALLWVAGGFFGGCSADAIAAKNAELTGNSDSADPAAAETQMALPAQTGPERVILQTRSNNALIRVTEANAGNSQIIRVTTVFNGEKNVIILNIDEPVYEIEIPLSPQSIAAVPSGTPGLPGSPNDIQAQAQRMQMDQYLELAQSSMLAGNYNEAIRNVDNVLQINPKHAKARSMKGSIYYAMGNLDLANQEWDRVLLMDPGNVEIRNFIEFLQRGPASPPPPLPGAGGNTIAPSSNRRAR